MARFALSVTLTGDKQVRARLRRFHGRAVEAAVRVIASSALRIQNGARRGITSQGAVDTGRTRDSVRAEYGELGLSAIIGTDLATAVFIEMGTRPHPTAQSQASRSLPPPGVLLDWMRRHGIPESAEFAIRLHIKEHGTPARPFLFPAFEEERPRFLSNLKVAIGRSVRTA